MSGHKKNLLERIDEFKQYSKALQNRVEQTETPEQATKRKERLLNDWEAFMKYYFPKYTTSDFAPFHRRLAEDYLNNEDITISRMFAREHGKSTFMVMLLIYAAVKKIIRVHLHVSRNEDNAARLLSTVKKNFESNQLLKNDFGEFVKITNKWTDTEFVAQIDEHQVAFRAIGMGQNPRGSQNDTQRVDSICLDDADDDEVCRSRERLEYAWSWVIGALLPTQSIAEGGRMVFLNNRIAKDCIIFRASEIADSHEQIDLLNEKGEPTWSARYKLDDCLRMLKKMGDTRLAQQEYFNNPQTAGTTFKEEWLQTKEMSLKNYTGLIAYLDPSFSSKKTADHKALVLIGLKGTEIHILKAYCDIATVSEMINWHYDLESWLKKENQVCEFYMEEVFYQSLLYKDFAEEAEKRSGHYIPVRGDKRKKPDKDSRISALAGFFERGQIFFNADQTENHHMKKLKEQFLLFIIGATKIAKDGPDAVEGAIFIARERVISQNPPTIGEKKPNPKRY